MTARIWTPQLAAAARIVARAHARYPWTEGVLNTILAPPEGPFALQGPATDVEALKLRHTAAEFRRMLDATYQMAQGVVYQLNNAGGDLKVTATGADVNVSVAAGHAVVRGTQAAGPQGMYHAFNDATVVINVLGPNPAHATLNRIDLVVVRVQDSFYSGAVDTVTLEMVTGTPAGSPAIPAAPANSLILAQILIPAASPVIASANITERRVPAGRLPIVFDDQAAAGPTATVTVTVPPGFAALDVELDVDGDNAALQVVQVQYNGDTTANYDSSRKILTSTATAVADGASGAAVVNTAMGIVPGSGANAAARSHTRATIGDVSSATLRKVHSYQMWCMNQADGAAGMDVEWGGGEWRGVAPITSILFKLAAGNFVNWRIRTTGLPG